MNESDPHPTEPVKTDIGSPADGRRFGWFKKSVFGIAALGALIAGVGFLVFANKIERVEPTIVAHAEAVVALTGGSDRIAEAVDLLAKGQATRLLITGVNQATTGREIAHLTPRFQELFHCCIDLGYEAVNTLGNAKETRRWVRTRGIRNSLIVVTSNYHMPRALAELSNALPDVRLVPYPVVSDRLKNAEWWNDAQMARLVATEYVKFVYAAVRMKIKPLPAIEDETRFAATKTGRLDLRR